jgi:hypothetical protein
MPADPDEVETMKRLYAAGLTMHQIAAQIGRSYAHVYHALDEAGVPFHRQRKRRGPHSKVSPAPAEPSAADRLKAAAELALRFETLLLEAVSLLDTCERLDAPIPEPLKARVEEIVREGKALSARVEAVVREVAEEQGLPLDMEPPTG